MAAAPAEKAVDVAASPDPLLLGGIGLALLVVGSTILALLWRSRGKHTQPSVETSNPGAAMVEFLLSITDPNLRRFIEGSSDPERPGRYDSAAMAMRIVSLWPVDRRTVGQLKKLAVTVAEVKSRLAELETSLKHVEHHSVTQDRVLVTVLGALTLFAGLGTVTTAVARVVGAN